MKHGKTAVTAALEWSGENFSKEEFNVLEAFKEAFESQRRKVPAIRLAGLAALAFQKVVGSKERAEDKIAQALARGMAVRQKLAQEEGGSASSDQVAQLLGISKTAVLNRRHAGRLLGWTGERQGAVRFPLWQFEQGRTLPGLEEVLEVLNNREQLDDWGKALFFLGNQALLGGRRPLDLLREQKTKEVVVAAEAFVE